MSRIGKKPVPVAAGLDIAVQSGTLKVKGPKGELSLRWHPAMAVKWNSDSREIVVERPDAIHDAACERRVEVGPRAADPHYLGDHARPLQRKRARAADQADADHHQFPEGARPLRASLASPGRGALPLRRPGGRCRHRASADLSAARNRSFSAGRPTEMRSHSGNP